MPFFVYEIRNKTSEKRYVGSTVNFKRRHEQHLWALRNDRHHSAKLQNSWNKHGADAFNFKLIASENSEARMIELEQFLLDEGQLVKKGYNINPVANNVGLLPKSEEHRRKIGLGRLGKRNTPESLQRMSESAKRRGPIKRSKESYERGAAKVRGRKMSEEVRAKLREAFKMRKPRLPMTVETKAAIAASKVGRKLINGKFVKVDQNA
jgi:group I intron endonuclease